MELQSRTIYTYVFVVLVYRNKQDLKNFFLSLNLPDTKVVVVNSFYDEGSDIEFRAIASSHSADFISVPNNGYGAGNNAGCEYVLSHYNFDYLVISNADILVDRLEENVLQNYNDSIIAPEIINLNGRKQNPSESFAPSKFVHHLMYKCYRGNHQTIIWIFYAWCRIKRIIFSVLNSIFSMRYIYSAHGAFVILPNTVIRKLHPIYNEKMFLMNEEGHMAKLAKKYSIRTVYVPEIIIYHKEDGSMGLEHKNEFPILKQSFMEFYKYWYK